MLSSEFTVEGKTDKGTILTLTEFSLGKNQEQLHRFSIFPLCINGTYDMDQMSCSFYFVESLHNDHQNQVTVRKTFSSFHIIKVYASLMAVHSGVSYPHVSSEWYCFIAFQDHQYMILILYFTIIFTDLPCLSWIT
jgi:hypothetical protein